MIMDRVPNSHGRTTFLSTLVKSTSAIDIQGCGMGEFYGRQGDPLPLRCRKLTHTGCRGHPCIAAIFTPPYYLALKAKEADLRASGTIPRCSTQLRYRAFGIWKQTTDSLPHASTYRVLMVFSC